MSRFLVTGGRGFIGSTLVRRLLADGHHVLNLDLGTYAAVPGALNHVEESPRYELVEGSISDRNLVDSVLADFEPTRIINLAAESHVDRSIDHPAPFIDSNVLGVVVLLEAATEYWQSRSGSERRDFRFVHVSTDEVFGSLVTGMATPLTRYDPTSPYAATKASSDHLVRAWNKTYGFPAIVTNCSNNYGPFQFPEKLIPLAVVRALSQRPIPIYGDGKQVRDWIHVDDHCRGLVLVCDEGEPGATYLIGARSTVTNLAIIQLVCRALDTIAPKEDGSPHFEAVDHVPDRPGHDRRYAIDPASSEELGFKPEIDLEAGITATVEWYVENRAWWQAILEHRYDTSRLGVRS